MKQIKLRAYDEIKGVMHNDFQFIKSGDDGNDWIVFTSDKQKLNSKPNPLENPYFQKQLKITQSTGIIDKNGVEIFEGDLIEFAGIGVVKYDEDRFYIDFGNVHTRVSKIHEVVGNIFETKSIGDIQKDPSDIEPDTTDEISEDKQDDYKQSLPSDSYWQDDEWNQPPVRIKHGDLVDVQCDNYPVMLGRYIGNGYGVVKLYHYATGESYIKGKVVSRGIDRNGLQVTDDELLEFIED